MTEPSPAIAKPDLLHRPWMPSVLYVGLAVLVSLLTIPTWGWTYWDFGDGNYMYIARRINEGLVLYKDILAPQPPLHTFVGMLALRAGEALFEDQLIGVRAWCLLVRLLGGWAIVLLAQRFFHCPFRAIAAGFIYLFLPIGFWWSLGYQSENLENLFLVLALFFVLPLTPKSLAIAGVFSALACHCNMTGVPYMLATALFLAFRLPRKLAWYLAPALLTYILIAVFANIKTEGYFLDNAILNQVGTFPRTDILRLGDPTDSFPKYAYSKIIREGGKVLDIEGGIILLAFVGMLLALLSFPPNRDRTAEDQAQWLRTEFLSWTFLGMLLSICFVAKGGTVNYIFVLGEPGVALFAAHGLVALLRTGFPPGTSLRQLPNIFDTRAMLRAIGVIAIIVIIVRPAWQNIHLSLTEQQVELPAMQSLRLRSFIETYAEPGDTILAPPFYAFLTGTNVAAEIAENYIWNIKYMNESVDRELYGRPTGEGVAKMQEVAGMLERKEVKVVLLDLAQTGQVREIQQAIANHYKLAEPEPFATRNTRLGLYIPNDQPIIHPPLQ